MESIQQTSNASYAVKAGEAGSGCGSSDSQTEIVHFYFKWTKRQIYILILLDYGLFSSQHRFLNEISQTSGNAIYSRISNNAAVIT